MSTRGSLWYNDDIHIYREMLEDNLVHVELAKDGVLIDFPLMPLVEWQKLTQSASGAGELVAAAVQLLKYRERILAMSLPQGHVLTAELAGALHELAMAVNKVREGDPSNPEK